MTLNPGPGHRRIPCPLCDEGVIRMADDSGTLHCSRLKWEGDGFSGGHCTFTTRDRTTIPLKAGERLVIRDFTPFAYMPAESAAD